MYFLEGPPDEYSPKLVSELVKPDYICADVGANYGFFTFLIANKLGMNGRVFSICGADFAIET